MKKIVYSIVFIFTFLVISNQLFGQLSWKVSDEGTADSKVYAFLGESDLGFGFIYTFPTQKWFSALKHGIAFRYYNEDLSEYKQFGLPEGSPPYLSLSGFNEYIVIKGTGEEKIQDKGKAVIMFLDGEGNIVQEKSWELTGNRHIWEQGAQRFYRSSDSAHCIVQITEQCIPDLPSLKEDPRNNYCMVFNRDLETVWQSNYSLTDPFKGDVSSLYDVDFINNDRVLVFGTETRDKIRHIVAYSLPQEKGGAEKLFDVAASPKPYMREQYLRMWDFITPDNQLVVFGFSGLDYLTRDMIFIRKDLNSGGTLTKKYYPMDKVFCEKYPVFGKNHKLFPHIRQAKLMDDGVIIAGDFFTESPMTSLRNISLIKFDFDGNIVWIKSIERNLTQNSIDYYNMVRTFKSGDDLIIFYLDTPDNVNGLKKKSGPSIVLPSLCLAYARMDKEGNILEKKVLHNQKNAGVTMHTSEIYQVDDETFILMGSASGNNAMSLFVLE